MIRQTITFLDRKGFVYIVSLCLMFLGALLPLSPLVKTLLMYGGMGIIYLSVLQESIRWANSIFKIFIWLLFAPFIISCVVIGSIELSWIDTVPNVPFTVVFIILFVASWMLGGYVFETKKVKVAMMIINAIVLSLLGLSFISNFYEGTSLLPLTPEDIKALKVLGMAPNVLIEILIKVLTLPYLLAGLWGLVVVELADAGVFRQKAKTGTTSIALKD